MTSDGRGRPDGGGRGAARTAAPASRAGGRPLDPVLRPRAVAVVGASADPRKRGFQAVRALRESGYEGAIYPVNPRGGELLGLPVSTDLESLPGPVDLALVCTPAASAPGIVAACGRADIPAAVLLAVGFGESGAEGADLEKEVAAAARAGGVRLVGPNTSGLLNLHVGLNLIGARGVPAGTLGLLVQSGNLALNLMLDAIRRSSVGLSVCVGVGNELDLGYPELLDDLAGDAHTRAILVHAEGFRRGPATVASLARASRSRPVVVLKAARTAAAEEAALSHTGAVAGSYALLRSAFRQAGVVEVGRTDELFHVGETLATQPPTPPGTGVAILSDGGGQGTLAVDLFTEAGTPLARTAEATRRALRELLGPAAAVGNPVDLAGAADGDPVRFVRALEILAADEAVGSVLLVGLFGGYARRFDDTLAEAEAEAAAGMAAAARELGRGLVVHTMYAPDATPPLRILRERGVPVVESLEVACRAVRALVERGRHVAAPLWTPWEGPAARARGESPPRPLPEPEARRLLEEVGMPLVPATFCADENEAVAAAAAFDGPAVIKVVADGVAHKSDIGGVAVGVAGEAGVREAFERVTGAARTHLEAGGAPAGVRGALVSPHLAPPLAELLVGVRRDPQVGAALTVGAGGVWVEALADVSVRVLPVARAQVGEMLGELRVAPLLSGARGRPRADLDAVADTVLALMRLLEEVPEVAEAEVNPIFVYEDRAVGVDARVYVISDSDQED